MYHLLCKNIVSNNIIVYILMNKYNKIVYISQTKDYVTRLVETVQLFCTLKVSEVYYSRVNRYVVQIYSQI